MKVKLGDLGEVKIKEQHSHGEASTKGIFKKRLYKFSNQINCNGCIKVAQFWITVLYGPLLLFYVILLTLA